MKDKAVNPEEAVVYDLDERLLAFSVRIGKVVDALPDIRVGQHVSGQLIRCGTSPGANYAEACAAESRSDFIHKLGVALKELRESRYWLQFIRKSELLPETRIAPLCDECDQLRKILGRSVVTAKANKRSDNPDKTRNL